MISKILRIKLFAVLALLAIAAATASAQVAVSPTTINFGSVGVGLVAHVGITLTNNSSSQSATVTGFTFSSNGETCTFGASGCIFGLREGEFPQTIPPSGSPGSSTRWSIAVKPTTAGTISGMLSVDYCLGSNPCVTQTPATASLTGTAVSNTGITASLSATNITFGDVALGTTANQTLTVTNPSTSAGSFNVNYVYSSPPFTVTGFSGKPTLLHPGDPPLNLTVYYSPSLLGPGAGLGASTGFVTVEYDIIPASGVSLSGIGVAPPGLAITSYPNLPSAIQGAAYQAALQATGGTPPYSNWQIISGSVPGLSLDPSTGIISGTVSSSAAIQNYTLQIQVQDSTTPTPLETTATLTLPVNATTGANCGNISWDVAGSSSPLVPLNDLGTGTYFPSGATTPEEGGLYPNGANTDSSAHGLAGPSIGQGIVPLDGNGNPDPANGILGLISIGPSTTFDSYDQLTLQGPADPAVNSHVVFVNGANPNETAELLSAPSSTYWPVILDYIIPFAGVTQNQIVAAWVDSIDSLTTTFPTDAQTLQGQLEMIAQQLYTNFPNIKVAYFGSLNYTGYSNGLTPTGPNPEPQAYDGAFADKWTIQDQIDGTCSIAGETGTNCLNYDSAQGAVMAPWIEWGPYYWANGLLARQDGTTWSCEDLQSDGTHPAPPGGENKINEFVLNFLKTDPTAAPWFLAVPLSPTSLTFASQTIGTTTPKPLPVTLTNNEASALSITGITLTGAEPGDFAQTNNCPSSLTTGTNCTINVTFTPTASGTRTAFVSVADGAPGSPQTVPLTGTGTITSGPFVSLSPTSLTFSSQGVGVTSSPQAVTLTNSGTETLTITSVTLTGANPGDFAISANTCGTTVAAGKNCTISVTFTPSTAGTRTASVSIVDNAPGSPQAVTLTGTGAGNPTGIPSPTSVTFPVQVVGQSSPAQMVTLTNTGTGTLTFTGSGISITADSKEFSETNACGTSLAAGANCTISVTYTPKQSSPPTSSGTLSISDNASGSPQTVALSGTGTFVQLVPTSLPPFASQTVGTTSTAQTVTLTNTLTKQTLTITPSITGTNPGDFAQTNTCGGSVAPGASCTFSVTFTPAASGTRSAMLSIADAGGASPQTVTLTGTGATSPVTLAPASLPPFASQAVGTTSAPQSVTLTNNQSSALSITSVALTGTNPGDFAISTNTCGSSVAAGGSCTISVTFTPTATGSRTASVTITDNAAGSPQSVPLTGTGTAPAVSLSTTSLTFISQTVGTTSAAQSVTLTNSGSATLSGIIVSVTGTNPGDYAQTNTCGSSVASGANCSISVTFTPAASGTRAASISIADNAAGSPQTVALSGTGAGSGASLSPPTMTFNSQPVGSISSPQIATLTNTGNSVLTISTIAITGPFGETGSCGSSLGVGGSCTISVTFLPTASGAATGTLTVTDSAPPGTQTIALSGTGTVSAYATLSPSTLVFPSTNVGSPSSAQTVTLTNTGDSALTLSSIALTGANSGDFTYTSTCGSSTLQPSANCTLMVTFKPTATGARSAAISITDNAPNSPQTVGLSGTGITTPGASLSPGSLTFASQEVGSTSSVQTVTLTNNGSGALMITSVSVTTSNFGQTTTCGTSLAVGASCTITVSFKPGATGNLTASVMVADNAPDSPQVVALTGTAVASGVGFSPSTGLVFKGEPLNTASAPQTLTLTNTGTAALSISSIAVTGANPSSFTQSNNCPMSSAGTLASGSACLINVTFSPTTGGNLSADLTVTDNAPGSPHSVSLTGAGSTFGLTAPSSSATVSAGQPAAYTLNFAPTGGFSGSVSLSCTTTAPAASCSVAPSTLTLNAPNTATATATVTTTGSSGAVPPRRHLPSGPGPWLWYALAAVIALGYGLVGRVRQSARWALAANPEPRTPNPGFLRWALAGALVLLLAWAGCGGGGSSTSTGPTSTPAGQYQVTVTAKAATASQNVTLSLTVQ